MLVINENMSSLFDQTLQETSPVVDLSKIQVTETSKQQFIESNRKASVNGIMFGNPKDLFIKADDIVDWHLLAWGTNFDAFTISWSNAHISICNQPVKQVDLLPASFSTVRISPLKSGQIEFGCNVHKAQGMVMKVNI
jgi:hypothetical protein